MVIGQILLGAALIGVALPLAVVLARIAGFALALVDCCYGNNLLYAAAAGNIGLALTLGGIRAMLTPVPKQPDIGQDPRGGFAVFWHPKHQPRRRPCSSCLRGDDRR